MAPHRRAHNYTPLRHWSDVGLRFLSGNGWMANTARTLFGLPRIQVRSYTRTIAWPHPHPPPLRIVFAADFHAGPITHPDLLTQACASIQQLAPDVVLLGGDYVSLDAQAIAPLATALGQIPAPLGRYAVLGNHDLWADDRPIHAALSAAGIAVLINESRPLPPPYERLVIYGLDDPTTGHPARAPDLPPVEPLIRRIILMHSPEGIPWIQNRAWDVAFCGHTHGGQVCLPNGHPLWLPRGQFNRCYPAGRYRINGPSYQELIVSLGIGYGGLPVRFYAPPDIICYTLTWSESTAAAGPNMPMQSDLRNPGDFQNQGKREAG